MIYGDKTCGDDSITTKKKYVEILDFKHFLRFCTFNGEGGRWRNKQVKSYIEVSVVIDMVRGNTIKE